MPDYAIDGIECQTVPERMFCLCMPVLLSDIKQNPDGIFT